MSKKTDLVKSGYAQLDYGERLEVKEFISKFDAGSTDIRKSINEDLNKALNNRSVGPRDSGACTCCGRAM